MASINFGLLNPNLPAEIMQAPMQGYLGMKAIADQDAARKAQADQQAFQNDLALKQFGLQEQTAAAQAGAAKLQNAKMKQDIFKAYMSRVAADPRMETVSAALRGYANTTGDDVSPFVNEVLTLGGDPQKLRAWAVGGIGDLKLMEPKYQDAGGKLVNTNPFSSSATEITKSVSADKAFEYSPEGIAARTKIAAAGAPKVSVNSVLEKEEQKEKGKINAGYYADIRMASDVARKLNAQLDTQEKVLNKGFDTGFGTEAKVIGASVLGALGVKDAAQYAANAQTFNAAAKEVVLQKQLAQKGPQTESDAKRIEETGTRLANEKDANRFILDVARAQNDRDIARHKFFDAYWAKNKTYEGAEESWLSGEGGKSIFESPRLQKYNDIQSAPQGGQIPQGWTVKVK